MKDPPPTNLKILDIMIYSFCVPTQITPQRQLEKNNILKILNVAIFNYQYAISQKLNSQLTLPWAILDKNSVVVQLY